MTEIECRVRKSVLWSARTAFSIKRTQLTKYDGQRSNTIRKTSIVRYSSLRITGVGRSKDLRTRPSEGFFDTIYQRHVRALCLYLCI